MRTLDWIGKKAVVNHHREVPFRLLQCDPELSVGDPESGNLLVQGDNLYALKALLPYCAGKVKCILIDPRIIFGEDETKLVELKVYSSDCRSKLSSVFELDGRRGTNEIKEIFPESKRAFNFGKPVGLIEEIRSFATKAGDIVLESLPPHDGPKVVCGDACRLGVERLARARVTFKQVPYEIRTG